MLVGKWQPAYWIHLNFAASTVTDIGHCVKAVNLSYVPCVGKYLVLIQFLNHLGWHIAYTGPYLELVLFLKHLT